MKSKNKYKRNKRYTSKIKGGAMLAASMASKLAPGLLPKEEKDSFLVKMMKYSTKVLSSVMTMLFSLPSRNLDELIPPKECKKYASNDYICSEPILHTLLLGTKADHKKILLDKDDCLQYDDKGNKIVSCKITGGYNPFVKDPDDGIENEDKNEKNKKNEEDKKNEKKKMTTAWFLKAKLEDLNIKLMQINLYLRKYKYPKGKIKELIEKIKDKELLQNMLDLCNDLLENDIYNDSYGYRERGLKCDKDLMDVSKKLELNIELKVKPDAKHIHFFSEYKNPTRKIKGGAMMLASMAGKALTSKTGQKMAKGAFNFASKQAMSQIPGGSGMDLSKLAGMAGQFLGSKTETSNSNKLDDELPPCKTCDGSPMFYAFGKYSSFLSDSILGRKDSLDYILINMIHEFASIKDNPIGKKIIEILKNIECRSNLRQVIQDQIDSLDSNSLDSNNDKLTNAIKSYMKLSKNAIEQMNVATKSLTQSLTSKPIDPISDTIKSYMETSKNAVAQMNLATNTLKSESTTVADSVLSKNVVTKENAPVKEEAKKEAKVETKVETKVQAKKEAKVEAKVDANSQKQYKTIEVPIGRGGYTSISVNIPQGRKLDNSIRNKDLMTSEEEAKFSGYFRKIFDPKTCTSGGGLHTRISRKCFDPEYINYITLSIHDENARKAITQSMQMRQPDKSSALLSLQKSLKQINDTKIYQLHKEYVDTLKPDKKLAINLITLSTTNFDNRVSKCDSDQYTCNSFKGIPRCPDGVNPGRSPPWPNMQTCKEIDEQNTNIFLNKMIIFLTKQENEIDNIKRNAKKIYFDIKNNDYLYSTNNFQNNENIQKIALRLFKIHRDSVIPDHMITSVLISNKEAKFNEEQIKTKIQEVLARIIHAEIDKIDKQNTNIFLNKMKIFLKENVNLNNDIKQIAKRFFPTKYSRDDINKEAEKIALILFKNHRNSVIPDRTTYPLTIFDEEKTKSKIQEVLARIIYDEINILKKK